MSPAKKRIEEITTLYTRQPSYKIDVSWRYVRTQLANFAESQKVDLDPDYQRPLVWTARQQASYVEHILRGGDSGKELYFNCADWGRGYNAPLELVDGKQRLNAVYRFLDNELMVFDRYYHDDIFDVHDLRHGFRMYVNDLPTRAEVLQWYLDINIGGTPHTAHEIEKVQMMLEEAIYD